MSENIVPVVTDLTAKNGFNKKIVIVAAATVVVAGAAAVLLKLKTGNGVETVTETINA